MQLRKPEPLWPADEDRIGARYIDAILDDVGSKQDVRLAFDETCHDLIDVLCRKAAMQAQNGQLRDGSAQTLEHRFNVADPRADNEALSAPAMLSLGGGRDSTVGNGRQLGHHRRALNRR